MRFQRLCAVVLAISVLAQAVAPSFAAASAHDISNLYNNYIGPTAQSNAEQVGPYNAFFANNKELIHPGNGNLMLSHTDLVLPGRNGLDLVMTRTYNSQQSNAYTMTSYVDSHTWSEWVPPVTEQRQFLVREGYWYSEWVLLQVGGGYWTTVCRNEWVEGYWQWGFYIDEWDNLVPYQYWVPGYSVHFCENVWIEPMYDLQELWFYVDPVYETRTVEVTPGYYRYYTNYWVETSRSSQTYLDRRHGLGLGWQWDLPSLEFSEGYIIYHSCQQSLTVDWNSASKFKDYPLLDIRFETDAQTFSNGQVTSHYRVVTKDGRASYFASDGRLLGIKDRYGNTITFKHTLWNGHHLIGEIIDSLGRITRLSYSQSAVELTAPDGRVWRYNLASTSTGKPVLNSAVDPLGRTTSYAYQLDTGHFSFTSKNTLPVANVFGNLKSVTYPTGGSSSYNYLKTRDNLGNDGARELYKISSRQDNIDTAVFNLVNYTYQGEPGGYPSYYSPFNLPSAYSYSGTMTKADGTTVKTTYNNLHLQTRVETEGPGIKQVVVMAYDSKKTPTQVTATAFNTSGGSTTTNTYTTFDQHNNLTSSTDARGTVTTYTYDTARYHQLTSIQTTRSDGVVLRTEYTVAANGNRTQERRVYVENGVNKEINIYYNYDQYGNLTQSRLVMEDGAERITQYEYSSLYQGAYLTKATVPYAAGSQVATIEYNLNTGQKTATVDPLNNRTTYQYDTLGRLTRHTNPDNTFRTYAYDDTNQTVTVTLENGSKSQLAYDRLGRLIEERAWLNNTWQVARKVTYDALSRKVSEENGLGLATSYHYDAGSRVTKIILPGNLEENSTYNDAARTVSVRDANNNTTIRSVDVLGRLTKVEEKPDPQGATVYT
ncbi:MAG: DUF6531 domain-containing protein, partial [Bacillota bacterium]|nr:DUF6531 domain-containing protein [Bacillota bacterium]